MEPELAAIESLCISLLSSSSSKKNESRNKLLSVFNGCANDWLLLFKRSLSSWPPSADDVTGLTEQTRRSISLLIICAISQVKSNWIQLIFEGKVEAFIAVFACDIIKCMRLFFAEDHASRYELRQLQLEFKEKLAVSFPSKGFMTEYLLNCDDIDEDLALAGAGDKPLWLTTRAILEAFKLALFSFKDCQNLSRIMKFVSPPLLQILDKTTDHRLIMSGLELASHVINTLDGPKLSRNHFDCVLLEALLNVYWVWSIGSHKELVNADNLEFVTKIFRAIDTLLDKDVESIETGLDSQIEKYKSYLKSRSVSDSSGKVKKSSKTRIDPAMPHLGKVEQFWCQMLQISQSIDFSTPAAELHIQKLLSIAETKLYPFISRNLSTLIGTVSIVALSAKFEMSMTLFDFLGNCISDYCSLDIEKYEGEILVLLVDYAHQVQTVTFREIFGPDKCSLLMEKLVSCLTALIEALRKLDRMETLIADWEALQGIEKLDLTWAANCFI